jgi:hypothetical protein
MSILPQTPLRPQVLWGPSLLCRRRTLSLQVCSERLGAKGSKGGPASSSSRRQQLLHLAKRSCRRHTTPPHTPPPLKIHAQSSPSSPSRPRPTARAAASCRGRWPSCRRRCRKSSTCVRAEERAPAAQLVDRSACCDRDSAAGVAYSRVALARADDTDSQSSAAASSTRSTPAPAPSLHSTRAPRGGSRSTPASSRPSLPPRRRRASTSTATPSCAAGRW